MHGAVMYLARIPRYQGYERTMMSGTKLLHEEVEKLAAPRHVVRKRGSVPNIAAN